MEDQRAFAEQLFGEALDLPRAERAAFLVKACRDAPAVQKVVEALLEENDRLSGFLSDPPYKNAKDAANVRLATGARMGRYTIVDQLGAGGMGVVYRARDEKLEREVAIKMVSKGVLASEEARRHFRWEALALAKLNHPRIASVYDVGEQDGADFLVMELVQGQSLATKLRAGPLEVMEATAIARQVAEALGEAHEHGVIHRDLKPANVMITPKGDAKVLDFGLAKLLSSGVEATMSVAETRGVLGTPVYMSPEQALGKSVDARTDLWSLGVLYYESLAGRPPFVRNSSIDVLHAITSEPLPSIRAVRPELPPLAEHIANRALEKDCDLRYQRAAEMETDLKRLARDLDPGWASASSVSGASSVMTAGARRGRRRVAMLAGAAVLLAAGIATAIWYARRPLPPLRVTEYAQITHDGHSKSLGGADGSRLYFNHDVNGRFSIAQVSISGGESAPLSMKWQDSALLDASPDGSALLVTSDDAGQGGLWSVQEPGGSIRHLAVSNSWVPSAAWSPDGKSAIYNAPNGDIFVVRSDGTGASKLTSEGAIGYNADSIAIGWSPDGGTIRFTKDGALWEISSSGSNLHRLLPTWHPADQCCGRWTPDGKFFIFLSAGQIWVLDERRGPFQVTRSEPVQLTSGPIVWSSPIPSKDGKKIFSNGVTLRGELARYDGQSKTLQSWLGGISAEFVAFSPDGRFILYVTFPEGILWTANRDGSNPEQLTDPPWHPFLPHWSPDGSQIVFSQNDSADTSRSYIVSSHGGAPQLLLPGDKENESDPSWSPDGRKIVFSSEVFGAGIAGFIKILELSSHQVVTIPGSQGVYSPRWSPNGRFIAGLSRDTDHLTIFDFETQKWSELQEAASFPNWSRDSQFIYFVSEGTDRGVFRVRVSGGTPERVVDLKDYRFTGSLFQWMGLDPQDSPMLLRDVGTADIYALTLEQN
jgi:serine/threonine protein kinase